MTATDRRRFNGRTPRGLTPAQRFWPKVVGGSYEECWLWTGAVNESGYGYFTYRAQGRRYCRACQQAYIAAWRSMTEEEREARKAAGLLVVDLAAYFANQMEEAA